MSNIPSGNPEFVNPAVAQDGAFTRRNFLKATGALTAGAVSSLFAHRKTEGQDAREMQVTEKEIQRHIEQGGVQWRRAGEVAQAEKHCGDGRCKECVVGSFGGDMGDLIVGTVAAEQVSGKQIADEDIPGVFEKNLRNHPDAFYIHTDVHAIIALSKKLNLNLELVDAIEPLKPETEERKKLEEELVTKMEPILENPGELEEKVLEALVDPDCIGCGHLKLMLKNPSKYPGARESLVKGFIKAFFKAKWTNKHPMHYEILRDDHHEKALVLVERDGPLTANTPVPLIKPYVETNEGPSSVFVVHTQIEEFSESQFARHASKVTGIENLDSDAVQAKERELRKTFVGASAEALAKGKPVFIARYRDQNNPINVVAA